MVRTIKVVFINPPIPELADDRLEPPLGILSVASYLKVHGVDVEIIDLSGQVNVEIPEADYYGFYTCTPTYHRALKIKDELDGVMIAGGPHASALPEMVAQNFDYVVIGEGETAMLDIVTNRPSRRIIKGLPIDFLDELPFIDYSLVDMASYNRIVVGEKSFPMLSSRGCPYLCTFCNSIIMGRGHKVRFRSCQKTVAEIKSLMDEYGVTHFRFHDDIFGMNRYWLIQFTDMVKYLSITYRAFVRADQCTRPGYTDLLYEGGCRLVGIGIESGSDDMLKRMSKQETRADYIEGIKRAKASGLRVRTYFIVGFPGETWDTVKETVDFIEQARPDEYMVYSFIPYPGTPVYHNPERYGVKNLSSDFSDYLFIYGDRKAKYIYETESLSAETVREMQEYIIGEADKLQLPWASRTEGQHEN